MHEKEVLVFREYIGQQLLQRHKAIGLRYAREHRFPELIGPRSYGIIFKDNDEGQLVFRLSYDSKPLYDNRGRNIPGRSIKTITDAYLIGTGDFQRGWQRLKGSAGDTLKWLWRRILHQNTE